MLHPDKANGQQAHDHARVPVILRALLLMLFLGVAGLSIPGMAKTAVLREVRMGNHGEYVRVVFEFSEAVQYQLSENAAAGTASIRFPDTTSAFPISPIAALDCINTVSAFQDGSHIVASLLFDPKGAKLNLFSLQGPDRLVLDVFCEEEPVMAGIQPEPREIVSKPQNPTPEPGDIATDPIRTATDVLSKKPEPTHASSDTVQAPIHQPRKPKEPPGKHDYFQKYLLLLLGAITFIIVLLIALIIFQKRSLSENHAAGRSGAARDTEDMMRTIDMKIKEKLTTYDE